MTRADDHRRLRRAVEKLTRPYVVSHVQRMPGGGRRTVTTTHSPLIVMLRTAGTPSLGAAGASASERVPVDDGALRMLQQLGDDVLELWEQLVPGAARYGIRRQAVHVERSLEAWHQLFELHESHDFTPPPWAPGSIPSLVTDEAVQLAAGVCEHWVAQIERRFDPPPSIEGTIACPECKRRWASSTIGDRVAAITITFGGSIAASSAVCRSCGTTWVGRQQLEDLAAGRARTSRGGHETSEPGDTFTPDPTRRHAEHNIPLHD